MKYDKEHHGSPAKKGSQHRMKRHSPKNMQDHEARAFW